MFPTRDQSHADGRIGIACEGKQRIFSQTLDLESVHVKQSAAPGLIDYPRGRPGAVKI